MEPGPMIDIARLPGEAPEDYAARMGKNIAFIEEPVRFAVEGEDQPSAEALATETRAGPATAAGTITSIDITRRPGLADHIDRHGDRWMLRRDPNESEAAFERRRQLFASDGRIALDVPTRPRTNSRSSKVVKSLPKIAG